ncbi:MAG: stage III sporulation AC/AD family protein [Clostridia bacterium]|nr:stage III sporulation AC/AD family protein [Clostridia bacterium]
MGFLQIIGLCLCAAFLCIFLSQYKKEYAAVIAIAVGAIILLWVFDSLASPFSELLAIIKKAGLSSKYFSVAAKAVILGYITQFVSETCRDFGCGSIAAKAELAGETAVFLICVPLLYELFSVITELL